MATDYENQLKECFRGVLTCGDSLDFEFDSENIKLFAKRLSEYVIDPMSVSHEWRASLDAFTKLDHPPLESPPPSRVPGFARHKDDEPFRLFLDEFYD